MTSAAIFFTRPVPYLYELLLLFSESRYLSSGTFALSLLCVVYLLSLRYRGYRPSGSCWILGLPLLPTFAKTIRTPSGKKCTSTVFEGFTGL